jgi:replication factor C subunit 1
MASRREVTTGNNALSEDKGEDMAVSLSGTVTPDMLASVKGIRRKACLTVPRVGSTLYVGERCRDGRPITESWKYKEAVRLGIPIVALSQGGQAGQGGQAVQAGQAGQAGQAVQAGKAVAIQTGDRKEPVLGWAEKYRPQALSDVIGHTNEIKSLRAWLAGWASGIPEKRAVLITGPPGIGKTTVIHLLAKEAGYAVTEYNASDTRSVSALRGAFALGVRRLRREVIVMDEVDGLSERGGVVEVAGIIKRTTVPMFCIANERGPKLKPLGAVCVEMRFSRPMRSTIATGLERVVRAEGLQVGRADIEGMCERNGNDIRAILHQLEFHGREEQGRDNKGDKDATHRMEPFSVTQRLFSQKKMPWSEATDLIFVDYHLIPLMVQEAYVHAGRDDMEAIAEAAEALSRGDEMTRRVYQTQDWSLIPHALAQPVVAAKRVPGTAPFQIFPQCLGKMSKQRKQVRRMEEIGRRVTGRGGSIMRLDVAEPLRAVLADRLSREAAPFRETMAFMDGTGVTRDDWWETLEETAFEAKEIPTKTRSAFTREWNKCHEDGDGIRKVVRKGGKKGSSVASKSGASSGASTGASSVASTGEEEQEEKEEQEEEQEEDEWDEDDY